MRHSETLFEGAGLSIWADRDATVRIRVTGEIDLANFPQFVEHVAAHAPHEGGWILDLRGVTYVDTTGIRALLSLRERLGETFVIAPSPRLTRILEITGLKDVFRWTEITE